jgi:SAM-dependent methyltransferase
MVYHGIDLSGVGAKECGLSEERSAGHRDSGGPDLDKLLRTLPICHSDTVLDIGCGKGGAMLTMAKYPFARVDGVELSPQLAKIAEQNLGRLRVPNAKVFCCDATTFEDFDRYNYFYMYNPFLEVVMRPVLNNINASLTQYNRAATLIYKNPYFHDLVISAGFRKVAETRQTHPSHPPFYVYAWEPVAASFQDCLVSGKDGRSQSPAKAIS